MRGFWSRRDPTHPTERVDRYRAIQGFRLVIGLHVDSQFNSVTGSIVRAWGSGKFLKIEHVSTCINSIPAAIQAGCRRLVEADSRNSRDLADQTSQPKNQLAEFASLKSDLAQIQTATINQLNSTMSGDSEKILMAGVCDPGLWSADYDGKVSYWSFCNADELAESSGMTVIDAFPARDVASGGRGGPLEALPFWFLMADRNDRVATETRFVIVFGDNVSIFRLPESDGLDSEIPQIGLKTTVGGRLFECLANVFQIPNCSSKQVEQLGAKGKVLPELLKTWILQLSKKATLSDSRSIASTLADQLAVHLINQESLEDVFATAHRLVGLSIAGEIDAYRTEENCSSRQIILAASGARNGLLINELSKQLPAVPISSTDDFAVPEDSLPATIAAILTVMHADQMPPNLPWLTGCDVPRVLGRLTPGRPHKWRQLLIQMADYHPPAMKLRDAV